MCVWYVPTDAVSVVCVRRTAELAMPWVYIQTRCQVVSKRLWYTYVDLAKTTCVHYICSKTFILEDACIGVTRVIFFLPVLWCNACMSVACATTNRRMPTLCDGILAPIFRHCQTVKANSMKKKVYLPGVKSSTFVSCFLFCQFCKYPPIMPAGL